VTPADLLEAPDEAAALEALHDAGCTDGLPVVIPTPDRVERMVLASGYDGDLVVGAMGPNLGAASIEKVAANAVMAGCLPDHLPVLLAAVEAVCDPAFDLTEVQSTTHDVSPIILVNGPARDCGPVASGFGALGPGHRANASIGRALRLCMINIGGGRPGISDMALLGHPGKFAACLAEAEEESPWPGLHTSFGYAADQGAVTVVGVGAPHSVVSPPDDEPYPDRLLACLGRAVAAPGNNNAAFGGRGTVVVVLNPEHAAALGAAGLSREAAQAAIYERAVNRRADLHALGLGLNRAGADDDLIHGAAGPASILLLVAGGGGIYSVVLPSWAAGPHGCVPVTRPVSLDQACVVPWMAAEASAAAQAAGVGAGTASPASATA